MQKIFNEIIVVMELIKYALRGVSIEQFATPFEPQTENIELNLNVPIKTNYDTRMLAIGANIQFTEEGRPFIIAEVFCHYEIDPNTWKELSEGNTKDVTLPKDFVRSLVAIAISTCRGALCAKTEKTAFAKFFVPLVELNPAEGEDLVIPAK